MLCSNFCKLLLVNLLILFAYAQDSDIFELSVIHFNDFHARYEETNDAGDTCTPGTECIGGISRLHHEIMTLKNSTPDSLLMFGGDCFQGTIWYSIGKWNVTQQFMNTFPIDVAVLGNHEFDDGIAGVIPYIKALNYPVVVSNIDDSLEPSIQNLYNKSIVIQKNGRKIGIIGVITPVTKITGNTGKLIFLKESASVNEEAERLVREEGVFTNIVLSHVGYDVDQQIAANASEKISLIVGAHSHTFLYTGSNPPGPEKPQGPYPTKVTSKYGHTVLITQASSFSRYVGNITIYLDKNGEIHDYSGAPIFLGASSAKDPSINDKLVPWRKDINSQANKVLGSSLVSLTKVGCAFKECTLGNFVTDSYVFYYTQNPPNGSWTTAPIGIIHAGGLRADIGVGNISYIDLVNAQPFSNTVDIGDIQGKYLKELFEFTTNGSLSLIQVSGVRLVYNLTKPERQQIESIHIRCQNCTIPVYKPLGMEKYYKIALPSSISGGDKYVMLTENLKNLEIGPVDVGVFEYYIQHRSPILQEEDERIVIHGSEGIIMRDADVL